MSRGDLRPRLGHALALICTGSVRLGATLHVLARGKENGCRRTVACKTEQQDMVATADALDMRQQRHARHKPGECRVACKATAMKDCKGTHVQIKSPA